MYSGDPQTLLVQVIERYPAVFAVAHEGVRLGYELANRQLASSPNMPGPFRIRSRRTLQNDYAVAWTRNLLQPFEEDGILSWVEEAETSTLRLDPELAIRIKKTDMWGQASNVSTGRNSEILSRGQLSLFAAEGLNELDGLPPELRWFNIAYVPDDFDVSLSFCGLSLSGGPILPFEQLDDAALAQIAPAAWASIVAARQRLA